LYGEESILENVWGRDNGKEYMAERVCWGMYGGESMVEAVSCRQYVRECMGEGLW